MDEKSRIVRTQNHILVSNRRLVSGSTLKINSYRKTLQIFRLPKSHLEGRDPGFRRRNRNVLNLAGVAVQRLFPGGNTLHGGARPGGGEWGGADIRMGIIDRKRTRLNSSNANIS